MDSLEKRIEELISEKALKKDLILKKKLKGLSLIDRIIVEKEESAKSAKLKLKKKFNTEKNILKFKNFFSDFDYPTSKIKSKEIEPIEIESVKIEIVKDEFKNKTLVESKPVVIELTTAESITTIEPIKEALINEKSKNSSKKDIILTLRDCILEHKKQMSIMQIFVRTGNFHSTNGTYPKNYTVCKFGSWCYTQGLMFASLKTYSELDQIHQNVHDYYLKIFSLFEKKIVGSIMNSKKRQELTRDKEIQSLWNVLKKQSIQFSKAIVAFENEIKNLSDNEFGNLQYIN